MGNCSGTNPESLRWPMPHTSHQNQDREESLVTADQVTGLCSVSHFPGQCENSWPKLTLASDWPGYPFRHSGIPIVLVFLAEWA